MLDRDDTPRREAVAVADAVDVVDDRNAGIAGAQEVRVQRVDVTVGVDRAPRGDEGLPGQFGGGVGYSESQSVILNGNFVHSNFMGTGNRIAAEINSGRYAKSFNFSHTDRYTTIDEVPAHTQYTRGVVAMAKTGTARAGTAGGQFFIVSAPNSGLSADYAIVGKVITGMDVVDRISELGTPDQTPSQVVELYSASVKVKG